MKNSNTLLEAAPPLLAFSDLGTHNIKIVLATVNEVISFPFTIIVTNSAPVFSTIPLSTTSLYIGDTKSYKLPSIIDAEGHTPTITTFIPLSFIKYDNVDTFSFITPTLA